MDPDSMKLFDTTTTPNMRKLRPTEHVNDVGRVCPALPLDGRCTPADLFHAPARVHHIPDAGTNIATQTHKRVVIWRPSSVGRHRNVVVVAVVVRRSAHARRTLAHPIHKWSKRARGVRSTSSRSSGSVFFTHWPTATRHMLLPSFFIG